MVVVCCLLWRNAKRMSMTRYGDAGAESLASLKQYPGDFEQLGRASPALSTRSGFTEKTRLENQDGVSLKSFQGGVLQPSPSTHSLRSLGLTRVAGPPQPHTVQGLAVGPGELPNTAGPFVNGGMHDLSH